MSDAPVTPPQFTLPIKNIVVEEGRGRKSFTRLDELASSLKSNGFINPLLVAPIPDRPGFYTLVAGERRWRAAHLAGLKEVPVSLRDAITALKYKELELEENVGRVDLTWEEESELHRQIDELKRVENPNWRKKDTAALVNLAPTTVGRQIEIAKRLREEPELRKLVADKPFNVAAKLIDQHDATKRAERLVAQGKIQITTDYRLGDCRKGLRELPLASCDLCIMDPPYGIEGFENLREGTGFITGGHTLANATHNMTLDSILAVLRDIAPVLAKVLVPGAHVYCFCTAYEVKSFAEALAPLEIQFPVLFWDREKGTSPALGYNYMNTTEAILHLHNPPRSRRLNTSKYNILRHPEVPRNLRCYPTEKPQSLLRELILQSSNMGDLVLDPFAGSGSTLKAAKLAGRRSIGFEIDSDAWHRNQLIMAGTKVVGPEKLFPDFEPSTAKGV